MSRSVDTLYRQWVMLSKIPRYPRRISAPELKNILSAEGYDIDMRTVQRDLIKLSASFPLNNDIEGKKHYWYWIEHATTQDLPGMEPITALAFQMAESYLSSILPHATLSLLNPYFNRAKEVLNNASTQLKGWPEKVAVIDKGPALIKPSINPDVQTAVYQALLEEKQLKGCYKKRHAEDATDYLIHPLGIVNRHNVIYLVCTLWDYTDIKQLALHRFVSADISSEPANLLSDFNLNDYVIKDHQFSYPLSSEPISLKILLDYEAVEHLYETPLTENQTLTTQEDHRILLEASITDTHELRWWLNGFGSSVEVLSPLSLREHFIHEIELMRIKYLS